MKIIGRISIILLVITLIFQLSWFIRVRQVKLHEFQEVTTLLLNKSIADFFDSQYVILNENFSCGMSYDTIFTWRNREIKLSEPQEFQHMFRSVYYDYLYENQLCNICIIDSLYRQRLLAKKITDYPLLLLKDAHGKVIGQSAETNIKRSISTFPIDIGFDHKHTITAIFLKPSFFHDMLWHIVLECIFLSGFIGCLIWQLRTTQDKLRTAKVQSMGVAHLEHELRKPLAILISTMKIFSKRGDEQYIKSMSSVQARLQKISDVTEMMLFALRKNQLELKREPVDIIQEIEMVIGMYRLLKQQAEISYEIEEGIETPLLDHVYFSCVLSNLIDNGIKYNKSETPKVEVYFGLLGNNWVLRVKDNGIGIPKKEIKRVFEQFYRIEDISMISKTGFGLGLTFVQKVVAAYKGSILIEARATGGTEFIIKLPRKDEKSKNTICR